MLLGIINARSDSDESMDAEGGALILREKDTTATGSNTAFLQSKLRYTVDEHGQEICMLKVGEEEVGVMMGWEKGIMQETVKKLCVDHPNNGSLKVLNVGFGLGIVRLPLIPNTRSNALLDRYLLSIPTAPASPTRHN